MGQLWQDLRFGARLLAKAPGVTAVALVTLALGIGAATSIFSVVDAVVFKPLPFRDPDRVLVLWEKNPASNKFRLSVAVSNFQQWRQQAKSVEGLTGVFDTKGNLNGGPNGPLEPEEIAVERTWGPLFPMLGVQPILGRAFLPEEDTPGHSNVAILSHSLWARKFGADPEIVGKKIRLRELMYTVVGVLPAGFRVINPDLELYVPMAINAADPRFASSRMLLVMARLKQGYSIEQARSELDRIGASLEQSNPALNRGWRPNIFPILDEVLFGNIREEMMVLLGAVGLLLLMACTNVANLLLAQGSKRQRELAIRTALGATRGRLVAQFLSETVMLALAGGALGLGVARAAMFLVARLGPATIPRLRDARMDGRMFLFALAVSVLTGILFGIVPALQGSRGQVSRALMEGGRGGASGRSAGATRSGLVVVEIALALVILIGAGLLLRSFERLRQVDPGFRAGNVLTIRIPLGGGKNSALPRRVAFVQQVIARVTGLPGVKSVGATSSLPLTGLAGGSTFWIDGRPLGFAEQRPMGLAAGATPDYFRTMGIPLLEGRVFNESDTSTSKPVAVIDQTLARRYFPQGGALGAKVVTDANATAEEIVGVVGAVKPEKLDAESWPTIYIPNAQKHDQMVVLTVRTAGDPMSMAGTVIRIVHDLDPEQPVSAVRPMQQLVDDALAEARFNALALALFAAIAFVLAAVGIYGVVAYDVTARTNEIGLRMALGAQGGDVMRLILGRGARLAAYGIAIGLVAAFGLTRLMESMLFGVNPRDFYTFAAIAVLLGAVALAASYVPARRAMRLDPMNALRHE